MGEKPEEKSLKELIKNIQEWFRYLLSKWLIIGLLMAIGAVLGFVYAYLKAPVYVATTTFVLEEDKQGNGLGSLASLASVAGVDIDGGGGIFRGENILELYKSRTMIERALLSKVDKDGQKVLLLDSYIDFNHLKKDWAKNEQLKNITFHEVKSRDSLVQLSRLQDSILGKIVDDINQNYLAVSKPDKKLSIIKADVRSENEFFAKKFNEEIVRTVNDFYVQTKTKKSLQNINILREKRDSVNAVIKGAISSAAVVTDQTPNLNPTRQFQRIVPIQQSQLSAESNKAVLSELIKNLEIARISLLKETPLIQIIDEPIFPLQKTKLGPKKALVVGAMLFGILTVIFLVIRKAFKNIMNG